ncbi:hypothetical protein HanRHA438_Chr03g0123291 [Helianthus annuus]|nr:hypothetical protein HanIR_Chr03g0121581 [Helianthus annuus]KAJ0935771.1 hypothetical protein HanRHA438_Chr03g0123291 [Helianthus annuus]
MLPSSNMEITPEGVRNNFIQLRELLNGYVREERNKGVRVRLSYDEPEVTLLPMPPPLCSTTSPSVSHNRTSPNPYLTLCPMVRFGKGVCTMAPLCPTKKPRLHC